jgi:predicted RNA binding protein YcfA (HicA-like mRNA interferase family)
MSISKRIRAIEALGWNVSHTRGTHLRCSHPKASRTVFTAGTPSDHRAWMNLKHELRRVLREGRTDIET